LYLARPSIVGQTAESFLSFLVQPTDDDVVTKISFFLSICSFTTMRRSKSDPSKYARNYKAISQRRMTQFDHLDEEKEMERLRSLLKNSETHLKSTEETTPLLDSTKNKRKRASGENNEASGSSMKIDSSVLSSELLMESGHTSTENPLIVLPSKKKKPKKPTPTVQLTPEEFKEAKALRKKNAKKLQQLEKRAAQKKKRAEIYEKLAQNKISDTALQLLSSSGKVSRKDSDTKKQALVKILNRERAGIPLNQEEKELLYPERVVEEPPDESIFARKSEADVAKGKEAKVSTKKKKANRKEHQNDKAEEPDNIPVESSNDQEMDSGKVSGGKRETDHENLPQTTKVDEVSAGEPSASVGSNSDKNEDTKTDSQPENPRPASGFDFAAQMMASLSTIKQETMKQADENPSNGDGEDADTMDTQPQKRYIPALPTQLKTAAALGIQGSYVDAKRRVMPIKRPEVIEQARYDLPVSAMEFEIMDAIRSNDVTIICGETGSGKSTQVPQFLYENGFCLNESKDGTSFLVGITQPRRVAAVSTAKRVCYEMGRGDGQCIKGSGNKGNLVSYRTRYETAGVGAETCVQFMTDGILLQEIQSDLLLRRYSVIVLDESHERNLNTDVLIGLLSVALPLRKKAAEEDPSLVPLKLVLMSATLRVEDFTKNEKLFPSGVPAVVSVPGRTHPVTIHHNKVTELDDYGKSNFQSQVPLTT
jgi:ATP-dependent RNA helicase DHX37/DHR1